MEAKDTVMSTGDLCRLVCSEHRSRTLEGKNCDGLDCEICQLNKQAEISFEAGIREVVEWVRANSKWHYHELPKEQWLYEPINDRYAIAGVLILTDKEKWQARLKEWGIDKPIP